MSELLNKSWNTVDTDDLKQLSRQINGELRRREFGSRYNERVKLIGKCFKYANSYGNGSDQWWLYTKVTGVSDNGDMAGISFQDDGNGRLTVETKYVSPTSLQTPISHDEWTTAFADFLCAMQDAART